MATPTGLAFKLNQMQLGKESVWGTAVAATRKLGIQEGTFKPNIQNDPVQEMGTLAPAVDVDVTYKDGGEIEVKGILNIEDFQYYQDGMLAPATPSGAGPYARSWVSAHRVAYAPNSYTIEFGQVGGYYKAVGCLVSKLEITGKVKEWLMVTVTFIAKEVSVLVSFAALADPIYTRVRGADCNLYIDAVTPKTTLITGTMIEMKVSFTTNVHNKPYMGQLGPAGFGIDGWEADGEVKVEFTSAMKAQVDAIIGATDAVKRFVAFAMARGSQTQDLVLSAAWDGSEQTMWEDENGNQAIVLKMLPFHSPTLGGWFTAASSTNIASI